MIDRKANQGPVLDSFAAAKLLAISEKTLRTLAAQGAIPGVKLGRQWRFDRESLLDHVRNASRQNVRAADGNPAPAPHVDREVAR